MSKLLNGVLLAKTMYYNLDTFQRFISDYKKVFEIKYEIATFSNSKKMSQKEVESKKIELQAKYEKAVKCVYQELCLYDSKCYKLTNIHIMSRKANNVRDMYNYILEITDIFEALKLAIVTA